MIHQRASLGRFQLPSRKINRRAVANNQVLNVRLDKGATAMVGRTDPSKTRANVNPKSKPKASAIKTFREVAADLIARVVEEVEAVKMDSIHHEEVEAKLNKQHKLHMITKKQSTG